MSTDEHARYLAEEIALDHADGHLSRREALRRLALLGLTVGSASSLLAACASRPTQRNTTATRASASPVGAAPALPPGASRARPTEAIPFPAPDARTLQGVFARAESPRGAVLVIHENRGLTDHIRSVAGRLAGAGYHALAVDLLSEEGGTAALGESANATAALARVEPSRFVADMRAGLDELARRAPGMRLGAVGFCFGGGMTFRLVASGDTRLAAAVPFYGPLPEGADFSGSRAAVLCVYAERDARVNATRDAARAALERAGLVHEIVEFAAADHAFFNDTGPRYAPVAAAAAWERLLAWFERYVG
jgi:carboxymethylenebutenolidase